MNGEKSKKNIFIMERYLFHQPILRNLCYCKCVYQLSDAITHNRLILLNTLRDDDW